jgi:hypothetical protein
VSRFVITDAERAQLWNVVAAHRKRRGDYPGAQMAIWTAKSIRSEFPLNKRPEQMRP